LVDTHRLCLPPSGRHQGGEGYNIILQTIPLDGKIALRPPKDDGKQAGETEREQQTVRDANDRRKNARR
jgi:hypothetical protein